MKGNYYKSRGGFTLAEAILAMVILGIAATGVLLPFGSGSAVRAEGARRTIASKLASDLMEQVLDTPFADVEDNYNYTESKGEVKDAKDAVLGDVIYSNFSREISSEYVYVTGESRPDQFIRTTIKVHYNGGKMISLSRLVGQ